MYADDLVRVRHMLDASQKARHISRNQTRQALEDNEVLVLALVRLIEVIGEAAAQMTREFHTAHPNIPWAKIIAMRNRLIHAYFDVDLDRLWDTVADDLPLLITQLEGLLQQA